MENGIAAGWQGWGPLSLGLACKAQLLYPGNAPLPRAKGKGEGRQSLKELSLQARPSSELP